MGDSFRPNQRDGDRDRDRNRPPSLMDRMTFTNGGNGGNGHHAPNSDLPRQSRAHHSQFTFHSTHPAPHFPPTGPSNTGSRGPPAAPRGHARDGPAQRHGGRGGRGGRSGRPDRTGRHNASGFRRGGFRKPAPHERALLRQRDDGVEHLMGVSEGPSRFKDLADLSNDETDGEYSGDSTVEDGELGDQAGGRHKISRTDGASRPDGNDVPKWSNPDPYTVLPPPETTGKGKDYVKIIRSAKNVDAEKLALSNAVSANDDFISFETEDEEQQEDEASDTSESSETDEEELVRNHTSMPTRLHHRFDDEGELEPDAGPARQQRKRKLHDDDNGPPIVRDWLPSPYYPAAPWFRSDAKRDDPEEWLHNEIMDFYDFVSPKPLEHQLRQDLVNRINDAIGPRALPHGTGSVLCFGSFPAGFYLPTADMDLVYVTNSHYEGGPPTLDFSSKGQHRKLLHQTSRILDRKRMSVDRPQVIAMAKVPLVKFVDSYTKLHVDISFENLSGVQAQATFDAWKQKYGSDLLHLVALIKQFLIMRGLNEVHTGGLGGFSIICLVVCYLANNERPHDFCACFMGFLDFYGNKFDLAKERIEMAPPGIVRKTMYGVDDRPEKPDGLSIQDPNRPENNISGGSHKAKDAFKAFAVAHRILQDRLKAIRLGEDVGRSILSSVLGGNYSSYIEQRRYMGTLNTRR